MNKGVKGLSLVNQFLRKGEGPRGGGIKLIKWRNPRLIRKLLRNKGTATCTYDRDHLQGKK